MSVCQLFVYLYFHRQPRAKLEGILEQCFNNTTEGGGRKTADRVFDAEVRQVGKKVGLIPFYTDTPDGLFSSGVFSMGHNIPFSTSISPSTSAARATSSGQGRFS